jgi:uncharacterized membrane protein YeaQ/YmgE (transglycosylase-associated protein family)
MGMMAWIVPGLVSGMIAKRLARRRRGPPGLIIIGVTGAAGARFAAGVGPTELGPLSLPPSATASGCRRSPGGAV